MPDSWITLRDVAISRLGYAPKDVSVMHNGTSMIVCGVRKEKGANVIELTRNMRAVVKQLNQTILKDNNLFFEIVYEQTPYINRAIDLVKKNVIIGSILAITVLLIFLRSISSTLTTTVAIPISVIGTFIFMWIFQRTLNVVSLAGLSFAIGMIVDNAIIVVENVYHHYQLGKDRITAVIDGTVEGISGDDPALAQALEGVLNLHVDAAWNAGEPVVLKDTTVQVGTVELVLNGEASEAAIAGYFMALLSMKK